MVREAKTMLEHTVEAHQHKKPDILAGFGPKTEEQGSYIPPMGSIASVAVGVTLASAAVVALGAITAYTMIANYRK